MNLLRVDFFRHSQVLHACLPQFEAQAAVEMPELSLELRGRNRRFTFVPQFYVRDGGRLRYSRRHERRAVGFGGWLPYSEKRWPPGKIAFKEFCRRQSLPTPPMWRSPSPGMSDFLVKRDVSSFAEGMRGPFRSHRAGDPAQAPADDRYYEQFIPGRSVKAWFWEDRVVALEIYDMPAVTGDGRTSLRELIRRASRPGNPYFDWERIGDLARFQDAALDEPLAAGRSILGDIRLASPLIPERFDSANTLAPYRDSTLLAKLQAFGPLLWGGIPQDVRFATLFTVDAVLDANENLWLLEMSCDPVVHPEAYEFMLETLFGPRLHPASRAAA